VAFKSVINAIATLIPKEERGRWMTKVFELAPGGGTEYFFKVVQSAPVLPLVTKPEPPKKAAAPLSRITSIRVPT
jgi:hypothetical protein